MQPASVVVFCALAAFALADEGYDKYDGVDVANILKNDRVLTNYIKCLLGEGPCTPEGRDLKKVIPSALKDGCLKCSEKQKDATQLVIEHLISKRPKDWDRLCKKFDPEGTYKQRYEEHVAKEGN